MAYRNEWCAIYSKQILYLWRVMGRSKTVSNSIREYARKHWHADSLITVKCVKKLQLSQWMEPFPMKIRKNNQASWADSRIPFVNVLPDWLTPVQRRDLSLQSPQLGCLSRLVHFLMVCVSGKPSAVTSPIHEGKGSKHYLLPAKREDDKSAGTDSFNPH